MSLDGVKKPTTTSTDSILGNVTPHATEDTFMNSAFSMSNPFGFGSGSNDSVMQSIMNFNMVLGSMLNAMRGKGQGSLANSSIGVNGAEINITPEQRTALTNNLNELFKNSSALKGKGAEIIDAAIKNKVNPVLFASIVAHETGNGKNCNYNNVAGMMNSCGKMHFASIEDGLNAAASNLNRNYISKGITSISAIAAKYAPVGASNDPTNLNANWTGGVSKRIGMLNNGVGIA